VILGRGCRGLMGRGLRGGRGVDGGWLVDRYESRIELD